MIENIEPRSQDSRRHKNRPIFIIPEVIWNQISSVANEINSRTRPEDVCLKVFNEGIITDYLLSHNILVTVHGPNGKETNIQNVIDNPKILSEICDVRPAEPQKNLK